MKILFINNVTTERCGVRAFGEQMVKALERAGDVVTVWDGTYTTVTQFGYLPPDLDRFDLIHLNWDPQAINHYLPEHFAGGPPLSLFLHDVPPNSTCPVYDVARWTFAHEPCKGTIVIPHAVPPTPRALPPVREGISIGVTGIRSDPGMAKVQALCEQRGWRVNLPAWHTDGGSWLSTDDEIRRLARNTLNVCWYQTTGRGKSMAAMFCCAARRPLVLSGSSMFSALWPYEEEIYFPQFFCLPDYHEREWETELEGLIAGVLHDLDLAEAQIPDRVCDELAWDRVITAVRGRWELGLR